MRIKKPGIARLFFVGLTRFSRTAPVEESAREAVDLIKVRDVVLAVIHLEPAGFTVGGLDEQPGGIVAVGRGIVVAAEVLFGEQQGDFAPRRDFCHDFADPHAVQQLRGNSPVFGGLVVIFMPLTVVGAGKPQIVERLGGGLHLFALDAPFFAHREVVGADSVAIAVDVAVTGNCDVGG